MHPSQSSRLLVLGIGPLPPESPERLMAPGLRTWSLAEDLARQVHRVTLVQAPFGEPDVQDFARAQQGDLPHGVEHWRVKFHAVEIAAFLRDLHRRERFDAAVATTDLMCRALSEARLTCPIWLDFNGHPMAERQMLAAVYESDDGLRDQWETVVPALLAGDRFSTCSESQRDALLGELALAGHLNERTAALEFVHALPPVVPPLDLTPTGPAERGRRVPEGAFIVLWTGGYNTWTDVDTLFEGLTAAMRAEPRLHYVSTGGAIQGHDDRTFARFESRVVGSPLRERFVLAGWVPLDQVRNYYAEADVAVNIDGDNVEGRLGHRNRVTEWILAGAPVVTTTVSDFTRRLAERDAVTAIPIGRPDALRDALLAHAADADLGRRQNANAREYLNRFHAPDVVYAPLRAWAASPLPAPDLPAPNERADDRPLQPEQNCLAERLAHLRAHPPTLPRKPFGFGLGIRPRVEAFFRRLLRRNNA
jgi:glycosyltransferase involved in cell wall biosynthesis